MVLAEKKNFFTQVNENLPDLFKGLVEANRSFSKPSWVLGGLFQTWDRYVGVISIFILFMKEVQKKE